MRWTSCRGTARCCRSTTTLRASDISSWPGSPRCDAPALLADGPAAGLRFTCADVLDGVSITGNTGDGHGGLLWTETLRYSLAGWDDIEHLWAFVRGRGRPVRRSVHPGTIRPWCPIVPRSQVLRAPGLELRDASV